MGHDNECKRLVGEDGEVEEEEEEEEEKEIEWRDSQIRWEDDDPKPTRRQKGNDEDGEDDDEEEEAYGSDLFASDPRTTFTYTFDRHNSSRDNNHNNNSTISVTLKGYTYESDQTWSSTGMTLWRASEYLCRYLVHHWNSLMMPQSHHDDDSSSTTRSANETDKAQLQQPQLQARRRQILELGAGLGLVGIVSHLLGDEETSVYLTDGDIDVLVPLRENVTLNRRKTTTTTDTTTTKADTKIGAGHISCHQLLWGTETSRKFLDRVVDPSNTIGGQTHHHQQQEKKSSFFNLILAADVVYVKSVVQPLWETVQTLLDPHDENAMFILAFARRLVDVTVDDVLAAAEKAGFTHQLQSTSEDVENGLYLFIFQRKR